MANHSRKLYYKGLDIDIEEDDQDDVDDQPEAEIVSPPSALMNH